MIRRIIERGGTNGNFTRKKNEIIKEYARHEGDTGSPEVQIAVLTEDINQLNEHARTHKRSPFLPWFNEKSVTVVTC